MLVLTRKQSETIKIGDSITITVLRMKGKSVRLGIQAPQHYNVIRGELAFELSAEELPAEPEEVDDLITENKADIESKPKSRHHAVRNPAWPTDSRPVGEASPASPACCSGAWAI